MPESRGGGAAPDTVPGRAAPETLLGFDFGMRRIGVAIGNTLTGDARPLAIVEAVPVDRRFERIAALLRDWQPQRLVVGRPLDEDGSATETTRLSDRFANQLNGRFGLPVERVDERFSSREAQAIIASAGGRAEDDDGVAAAVILSQYLDGRRRRPDADPAHETPTR
ncbi:MAG: Holliday junction resolvase RuvX [Burkholderiales bacterium]|nr:Holliday junction resolvase RuvX [Burkholderiales bacterium]